MSNLEQSEIVKSDTTGHPPGLPMLFFAEMWERFCFYGMRALLVLYLTKVFMYSDVEAYAVYGSYNSMVYLTPLIGGFIADKFLGYRVTILLGGAIMALGQFTMIVESQFAMFAGMALIIVGNGMFKPNISTLVGRLYAEGDSRRDAGFTIFYIGINLGALLSTTVCGFIGETYGYNYGFGLAGIGMTAGLITFTRGKQRLEGHGEPPHPEKFAANLQKVLLGSVIAAPCFYLLLTEAKIVQGMMATAVVLALGYLIYVAIGSEKVQRERLFVLMILWVYHLLFWAFFEQAGSSLTKFTERNIDRGMMGWEMPISWGQNFNPAFILIFGALFSILWVKLSKIGKNPSIPAKFGLALMQLGLGYGVLVVGADMAGDDYMVPLIALVLCYLLHTTGELCLSPVGLSAVTKLAPKRMTGLVMGIWFLSIASAHSVAAQIAMMTGKAGGSGEGELSAEATLPIYVDVYNNMCWIALGVGIFACVTSPFLKKWLHGVE